MISPYHFINKSSHTFTVILYPVHYATSVSDPSPFQQQSRFPITLTWDPYQGVQRVEGKKMEDRVAGKG